MRVGSRIQSSHPLVINIDLGPNGTAVSRAAKARLAGTGIHHVVIEPIEEARVSHVYAMEALHRFI